MDLLRQILVCIPARYALRTSHRDHDVAEIGDRFVAFMQHLRCDYDCIILILRAAHEVKVVDAR